MILVDTSVWVQHFRRGNDALRALLNDGRVFCHPFVIGELACGTMRNRQQILSLLQSLPQTLPAQHEEVLYLLDSRRLYGQGVGWIDAHLLSSALLSDARLWTLDRTLRRGAVILGISYELS